MLVLVRIGRDPQRGRAPEGRLVGAVEASAEAFAAGQSATWIHVPRGGYGYAWSVSVVVRKVGPKRVRVEAPLRSGGTRLVWVSPSNLRPRGEL